MNALIKCLLYPFMFCLVVQNSKGNLRTCFTVDQCSCRTYNWITDQTQYISLQELDSSSPNGYKLTDFHGNSFSYRPCTPFSSAQHNDSLFLKLTTSSPLNLATPSSMTTMPGYLFAYHAIDVTGIIRSTFINLVCDETQTVPEFSQVRNTDGNKNLYDFTVKTKCACLDGCSYNPLYFQESNLNGFPGSLSTLSLVFVMLFTIIAVYIIGGALVNKVILGKSGLAVCPHSNTLKTVGFWIRVKCFNPCLKICIRNGERNHLLEVQL